MITPSAWGQFEVEFSGNQRARVKQLASKARLLGGGDQFTAELKAILDKLESEPREWGDPLFALHALKLIVYRGIHARMAVTFAVHDRLPIVFIRDFEPILDHPLAGG